jgi:hypothetical protein
VNSVQKSAAQKGKKNRNKNNKGFSHSRNNIGRFSGDLYVITCFDENLNDDRYLVTTPYSTTCI